MVFEKLGKILECSLDNIELLVLQITSTNAKRSVSFSNACCLYDMFKDDEHGLFWSLKLTTLFDKGVKFLSDLKTVTPEEIEKMDIHNKAAVKLLGNFVKTKDKIEKSLHKVLRSNSESPITETDLTIVLAEHLLGKLAPGGSYVIDANTKNKDKCKCGCGVYPAYESTGIGHEEVWHGHVDMILSSHRGFPEEKLCDGIPVHCYTETSDADTSEDDTMPSASLDETPCKRRKSETERLSPGDNTSIEVKKPTTSAAQEDAIEQALAQTIVFSLLQKQRHANLDSYLMPCILITPHSFQITMYDAENDILLCSNEIPLFLPPSYDCLNPRAVLTLWLVLHYRMFCSGLKLVDSYTLKKWKSNFKVFVDSKWEIYSKLLKDSVPSFSVAECMYNWKEMNMYTQSYLPGNS